MSEESEKHSFQPAPEGWTLRTHSQTFSTHAGPFYFREGAEPGVGFYSAPHHGNLGGVVHGGMLMTLADMALFDACFRREGKFFKAVTVTMNSEFLNPAPIGTFIEAAGEVVKAGGRFSFVRGLITAEGETLLSFSGSLMRIG